MSLYILERNNLHSAVLGKLLLKSANKTIVNVVFLWTFKFLVKLKPKSNENWNKKKMNHQLSVQLIDHVIRAYEFKVLWTV